MRYHIVVARPFSEVEPELLANLRSWLPLLGDDARIEGTRLLAELGYDRSLLAIRIETKVGRARRTNPLTRLPIELRADAGTGPYPALVGQLEIAPIGPNTTHVGLTAVFAPPIPLGARLKDRARLNLVAEAAVGYLMEQLRARLTPQQSAARRGAKTIGAALAQA